MSRTNRNTRKPVHAEATPAAEATATKTAKLTTGKKVGKGKAAVKGKGKATSVKPVKAARTGKAGVRDLDPSTKIKVLVDENPHRKDSVQGKRFAIASKSATVQDFIDRTAKADEGVAFLPYLRYAERQGFIKLG